MIKASIECPDPKFYLIGFNSTLEHDHMNNVKEVAMKENIDSINTQSLRVIEQEGIKNIPRSSMRIGPTFNKQLKSYYEFGSALIKPKE